MVDCKEEEHTKQFLMPKLTTKKLSIGYGQKVIAEDLNLQLSAGRLVCLLGQNGVGKSTLLRTLANLQQPISGEVLIDDLALVDTDRTELAKKLGLITTDKIGTSNMSIRELVALGRFPYTNWMGNESDVDQHMIEEAISKCKINYIENAKLGSISDGQFQKAMVARVLAQDTDIILMDEPTAHLDVVNRIEMFRMLSEIIMETGKSILVSTHEMDLSIQFADELWLMNYNSPIITGTPDDMVKTGKINEIFYHEDFDIDLSEGRLRVIDK